MPGVVVRRALIAGLVVLAPFVALVITAVATPLPGELFEATSPSIRVVDRDGRLLREVRADDGKRASPLSLAEDRRHGG